MGVTHKNRVQVFRCNTILPQIIKYQAFWNLLFIFIIELKNLNCSLFLIWDTFIGINAYELYHVEICFNDLSDYFDMIM